MRFCGDAMGGTFLGRKVPPKPTSKELLERSSFFEVLQDAFHHTKQYFSLRKKQVGRLKALTCFICGFANLMLGISIGKFTIVQKKLLYVQIQVIICKV